jgi:hypothetical protein
LFLDRVPFRGEKTGNSILTGIFGRGE